MASICVFCGSRTGAPPEFADTAREFGTWMARHHHRLIYGGGGTGIMGVVADSVLAAGGEVTGIITTQLATIELMHPGVADMRVTANMHERKALMHSLADLYVALPGGFGTMEELFEAVTWAQLELHSHPIAALNQNGVYDGLVHLIDAMTRNDFLKPKYKSLLTFTDSLPQLTAWIQSVQ